MSRTLPPIHSSRYQGRFAVAAPEVGIPYLAEASLQIVAAHDRHSHDEIQVLWVLDGDMGMEIGRACVHVRAGQGLILLPGCRHRVVLPPDMTQARSQIIDLRLVDDRTQPMPAFVHGLPAHVAIGGEASTVLAAAERLRVAQSASGPARTARMLSAVWDLLAGLSAAEVTADVSAVVASAQDTAERRLLLAEQFMADHLSDPIGVEAVAEHVGLSRSQLTRLMVERRGAGPAQALRRLRVDRARFLLRQSTLSIKEIARVCGFASQHHFSRVFFQITGQRPTTAR